MAISSAFKSAYTNEVAQQNQGINTITSGVKDLGTAIVGALGFTGALGSGGLAKAAQHTLAGKVGGIGGNIMLATMQEKMQNNAQPTIYDIEDTEAVNKAFDTALSSNVQNVKAFETVWDKLTKAREQKAVKSAEQEIMKNLGGDL